MYDGDHRSFYLDRCNNKQNGLPERRHHAGIRLVEGVEDKRAGLVGKFDDHLRAGLHQTRYGVEEAASDLKWSGE